MCIPSPEHCGKENQGPDGTERAVVLCRERPGRVSAEPTDIHQAGHRLSPGELRHCYAFPVKPCGSFGCSFTQASTKLE